MLSDKNGGGVKQKMQIVQAGLAQPHGTLFENLGKKRGEAGKKGGKKKKKNGKRYTLITEEEKKCQRESKMHGREKIAF